LEPHTVEELSEVLVLAYVRAETIQGWRNPPRDREP